MKLEKQQLLGDLLDGQRDAFREATLRAGGRVLRRRRWQRRALRGAWVLAVLLLAIVSAQQFIPRRPALVTVVPPPTAAPVQSLTDAELMALFPDTPVGLVTLEDGRKRLIFPRPGDEARFVRDL